MRGNEPSIDMGVLAKWGLVLILVTNKPKETLMKDLKNDFCII
jgi:hypothetical protein